MASDSGESRQSDLLSTSSYDYRPTSDDTKSNDYNVLEAQEIKSTFDEIIMLEYRVPDH